GSAVVPSEPARAIIPSPTTHGVFGIARTHGLLVPSISVSCASETPATMETSNASGLNALDAFNVFNAVAACAGLTHSTTMSALGSRCAMSRSTLTPSSADVLAHVWDDRDVPHAWSGINDP